MKFKKKVIYTLNVGMKYCPQITNFTYPLMRRYAEKIDADFYIITERKFPDWPIAYEKLQIHTLAKEQEREWIYYIDSDALVHPEFFDITNHFTKDVVIHNGSDLCNIRWKIDDVFRKDGRYIGSCNWFTIASDWCIDLWHPLEDLTLQEALDQIYPTVNEAKTVISKEHLLDDYVLSRNIAKYGFHFSTVTQLLQKLDPNSFYLYHEYTIPLHEKVMRIKQIIKDWGLV